MAPEPPRQAVLEPSLQASALTSMASSPFNNDHRTGGLSAAAPVAPNTTAFLSPQSDSDRSAWGSPTAPSSSTPILLVAAAAAVASPTSSFSSRVLPPSDLSNPSPSLPVPTKIPTKRNPPPGATSSGGRSVPQQPHPRSSAEVSGSLTAAAIDDDSDDDSIHGSGRKGAVVLRAGPSALMAGSGGGAGPSSPSPLLSQDAGAQEGRDSQSSGSGVSGGLDASDAGGEQSSAEEQGRAVAKEPRHSVASAHPSSRWPSNPGFQAEVAAGFSPPPAAQGTGEANNKG